MTKQQNSGRITDPRLPDSNMFATLGLLCDKRHQHQSWRPRFLDGKWVFPTKEEGAYPMLLCVRMASLFLEEAKQRGLGPDDDLMQQRLHDETGRQTPVVYHSVKATEIKAHHF